MPVNAALALSPNLRLLARDRDRERDTLHELASWAIRFTPAVSIDPCGALLLEIATTAGLFGGPAALRAAVAEELRQRGHVFSAAVMPTAQAALWLARAGQDVTVTVADGLPGVLAPLPVSLLGWPVPVVQLLRRMGVNRLGECMRLPRDGLARRIGESCLHEMDLALGRLPELRQLFRPETRFCSELELAAETREAGPLVEALRLLLSRLRMHAQSRQSGAQILWLRLRHQALPDTLLRIGLLRPSADAVHLQELVAIHLSVTSIPAPVIAVGLEADLSGVHAGAQEDLLGCKPDRGERIAGLIERLKLRLGLHAVYGVWTRREHRPERAWQMVADPMTRFSGDCPGASASSRPLWILERPQPLGCRDGRPFFHGPLQFESGPERIETGWWDGHDVRRDYYAAMNPGGVRAWVFKDLRAGGWYLHGLFG